MTSPRLNQSQAIQYQLQLNPRLAPHRHRSWEVLTHEWDLLTVASKNFTMVIVEAVAVEIAKYSNIMVVGVAQGELFKHSTRTIYGVDRSAEIHSVAGANARARGTTYHAVNLDYLESHSVDLVVIDCTPDFYSVVEYVFAHHSGAVVALHKSQQTLEQMPRGNRRFAITRAGGEPKPNQWRPNGPMLPSLQHLAKTHSMANIGPDLAGINNTTHRK